MFADLTKGLKSIVFGPQTRSRIRLGNNLSGNASRSRTSGSSATSPQSPAALDEKTFDLLHEGERMVYSFQLHRWLWNEEEQLARRFVKFDVAELAQIAARSVKSETCVEIHKLPEGSFNKVLHMIMDDGKEVIAKVPNPNAGSPHFTTASEVATMDYVSQTFRLSQSHFLIGHEQ